MPSVTIRPYALQFIVDKLAEEARAHGRAKAMNEMNERQLEKANSVIESLSKELYEMHEKEGK